MNIAVLIKQVPDTYSERHLRESDHRLDRDAADAVIDEVDSRGVEIALQLTEAHGGEVTVVTMGPKRANETIRKALAMGAARGVHIQDDGLEGADALTTSAVLAAALRTIEFDLLVAGNESTDGRVGAMAGMLAERLGLPGVTQVQQLDIADGVIQAQRADESGYSDVTAPLPAVISVTEKITEPRYPNFKGIMRAKKKPVSVLTLAELGLAADNGSAVLDATPRPPKEAGEKVSDDGNGGTQIADYLTAQRLI